eukprot:4947496-Pyramimonas_sp.AAC.1
MPPCLEALARPALRAERLEIDRSIDRPTDRDRSIDRAIGRSTDRSTPFGHASVPCRGWARGARLQRLPVAPERARRLEAHPVSGPALIYVRAD